jgi:hypothetical protein
MTALERMLSMTFHYEDSSFSRSKDGFVLPDTPPEVVARLNKGLPWESWGGLRLSKDRCFFVLPTGKCLLPSMIRQVFPVIGSPCQALVPILSCPNGQVKNFLNACRAVGKPFDQMKVAVVGSKSMEGSGIWHAYFLRFLQIFQKRILVDFYDFAEREDVRVLSSGDSFISAEWIVGPFSQELCSKYDVIIDDAWLASEGPGLHLNFKGRYSWKGSLSERAVPFLHPTETREFSEAPQTVYTSECRCPTCRVISECITNHEEYLLLRTLCSRIGYLAPCVGIDNQHELRQVASLLRQIVMQPSVDMARKKTISHLISLTEEIGVEVHGRSVSQGGVPHFEPFSRFRETLSRKMEIEYFTGKSIAFAGVPPTILGTTKIKRSVESWRLNVEILFVNSLDTWSAQATPDLVYIDESPAIVHRAFPEYVYTGRNFLQFKEYKRIVYPSKPLEINLPKNETRTARYVPWPGFHNLSTTGFNYSVKGPAVKGFELYSLSMKAGKAERVSFEPSLWRSSIYVNTDGSWGLVKSILELLGQQRGFLQAAVPLPWDMLVEEVLEVERRLGIVVDRSSYYTRSQTDGINSEWKRLKKNQYVRSERCHPVSWIYHEPVNEVIQDVMRMHGYYDGYEKILEYSARLLSTLETT